jgi:glucose-1-phosphate thymidylyltransferase
MFFKGLIAPADGSFSAVRGTSTALQRVANRPIVCHVLEAMLQAGVAEVALLVSASESSELRACISVEGPAQLSVEYVPYEDGLFEQALEAVWQLIGEAPCVVHAANGLLAQPLAPLLGLLNSDARDLLALVHRPPAANGSIGLATRRLLRLAGAPTEDGALDLAGACVFGPGALREATGECWPISGRRCDRQLDLVAVAERLTAEGRCLGVERVSGWRRNTGEVDDLLELNRIALDALTREAATTAPSANRFEGYVDVHPTACMQSSVIVGPATVGAGAEVLDSYIGPYTSIGAGVRIEGAEVERSIILPGASITHIGGRLVGSVVGRDARIFRDFSLPRALRLNVGDGDEVALC